MTWWCLLDNMKKIKEIKKSGVEIGVDDGGKIYLVAIEIVRIKKKMNEIIKFLNENTKNNS